jgi:mannose-1-phosphate guanylyltransferase
VDAVVLAAGAGTRLGAAGRRLPKVLMDVGGRPLLAWQLERLHGQGFTRVVVNAHHLAEQIEAFAAAYDGPLELTVLVEPALLGTAGGVRNALAALQARPFLVLYGDVVTTEPFSGLIGTHGRSGASATLAVHESPTAKGKGVVEVDREERVTRFAEKGARGSGPALANSGIYVLEPSFVEALPLGVPLDFGYDVFPQALERGERIVVHRLATPVIDAGTPDGLAAAQALVQREKR